MKRTTAPLANRLDLPNPIRAPGHELSLTAMYTARRLSAVAAGVLRPFGLTESSFNVLMLLAHQSDGSLTHGQLSRRMLVRPANVTGVIDRMERDGLVRRRAVDEDRRVRRVELTAAGRKRLTRAEGAYLDGARAIAEGMSDADARRLQQLLLVMCDAIDEIDDGSYHR